MTDSSAPLLDMPTQIGFRYAALEAAEAYNNSDIQNIDVARDAFRDAIENSELLSGAGSQELANAYVDDIMANATDAQINGFLSSINTENIGSVRDAIARNDDTALMKAAGTFVTSFRENIEDITLTESFRNFTASNPELLDQVDPQGFTAEQAATIREEEARMRNLDRLDGQIYELLQDQPIMLALAQALGFGYPEVMKDNIAAFDASQYPERQHATGQSTQQENQPDWSGMLKEAQLSSDITPASDDALASVPLHLEASERGAVRT